MTSSGDAGLTLRAKLAVTRARIEAAEQWDRALVAAGSALGALARRAILQPHRAEKIELPEPYDIGGHRLDVLTDLRSYTGLPEDALDGLVRRRSNSFRVEWFLTPETLRTDDWFYLSSTTYLFGNAAHDPRPLLELVSSHAQAPGSALDFGGGAGNLALALAAAGWTVSFIERSALQKDFVAFRAAANAMQERLRVVHGWEPLQRDTYDLVCAIDVLEHVEDLFPLLQEQLLPSIRAGGLLLESSPFVRNLSNPMHHEHHGFEEVLRKAGFSLEAERPDGCRLWRRNR